MFRSWSVRFPYLNHAEGGGSGSVIPDPNPAPQPEPAPAPGAAGGRAYITCDFCESRLTREGEVLRLGTRARAFRDREERETAREAELESLRAQLQTVRERLAEREREIREDAERSGVRRDDDRL